MNVFFKRVNTILTRAIITMAIVSFVTLIYVAFEINNPATWVMALAICITAVAFVGYTLGYSIELRHKK